MNDFPRYFIDAATAVPDDDVEVMIVPVPYEATTTYRKGCQEGPIALLAASDQLEHYDVELQQEPCFAVGIGIHDAIADTRHQADLPPEVMVQQVEAALIPLLKTGKFVITLGGEHGITAGVVAAYQQVETEPFTVVQIDAHGDLRHSYQGSIYNHACVMRRIVDRGIPLVPVAIRSICKEEADLIASQQIPVQWDHHITENPQWIEAAIAAIQTDRVFLTIDLDGLDPAIMPGVGTPQPGGLNWAQTTRFLRTLFTQRQVIGCDVMELAPLRDAVVSEFIAAKLVYKLIGYHALSRGRLD